MAKRIAKEETLQEVLGYLKNNGRVVKENSTTTALAIDGTFTGEAVSTDGNSAVIVSVYTDKDGTLYIDFSPDKVNWDSVLTYTHKASLVNPPHRLTVTRGYFRVRFYNSSGQVQSYLRLQTLIGNYNQLTSPLNSSINPSADATLVRPLDFNLMVAEGLYQNRNNTVKDAINFDIDSGSVPEDIWDGGGVYTGFPSSAAAAEIVVAGADTGTVYYSYMATDTDTDYTISSVEITGIGTYALGHNVWRCNFMYFQNTATNVVNVGDITMRHTATPANIFCVIVAAYGQTYCGAYTVPYGSSIYIDRFTGNVRGSATASLDGFIWYRPYGGSPYLRFPFELQFGTLYFDDVDYLIKIPERVDFIPRIVTSSANNITAKFSYRLIKVKS